MDSAAIRRRVLRPWLAMAVLAALGVGPAESADPAAPPDPPGEAGTDGPAADPESRLQRILHRFFGNHAPSGEDLRGRAERAEERFRPDEGAHIEVVIVHPVDRFERRRTAAAASAPQRLLDSLTQPLHSYTRDGVIRDFLLFSRGEEVDPYLLADSERLLRRLRFISDARIEVVPLNDRADTVAVVVQTVDSWPLGADADVQDVREYRASLYSVNVAGTGLGFANELLYREGGSPDTGYRGTLRNVNVGGGFWNFAAEYEDSHFERQDRIQLERPLAHAGITLLGGASWDRLRQRREEIEPSDATVSDAWGGVALRLYDRRDHRETARPVLVPALRIVDQRYSDRPAVTADLNRAYHESRLALAGLYYRRIAYYRTSYLLGLGETETVPRGFFAKAVGGYQDGEFRQRVCLFLSTGGVYVRDRGDVVLGTVDWGGYFRNRSIEQGLVRFDGGYYSALFGGGDYRLRFSGRAQYLLGIRRAAEELLSLRPQQGLEVLPEREVQGGQRLTSVWEATLFTTWSIAGFKVSCFGFVDAGVVGPEKAASLWQEKFYYGSGLGVNLRNPELALPTWRIFGAVKNRVEDGGSTFQLGFQTATPAMLGMPGAKPATPVYR